jgi:hypothetical protein
MLGTKAFSILSLVINAYEVAHPPGVTAGIDPDFAKKVRSIVVEFGSTTEQSTLDRYIRGENVSRAQLEQVWKITTQAPNWSPLFTFYFLLLPCSVRYWCLSERLPFRDFTAEEFLGRTLTIGAGGCVSVFPRMQSHSRPAG